MLSRVVIIGRSLSRTEPFPWAPAILNPRVTELLRRSPQIFNPVRLPCPLVTPAWQPPTPAATSWMSRWLASTPSTPITKAVMERTRRELAVPRWPVVFTAPAAVPLVVHAWDWAWAYVDWPTLATYATVIAVGVCQRVLIEIVAS